MSTRFLDNDNVHPHHIKWDKGELKRRLHRLWLLRDRRSLVVQFDVRTYRMVGALRREFDYSGFTLRAITMYDQGKPGWLAISIRVKYRGNRPAR